MLLCSPCWNEHVQSCLRSLMCVGHHWHPCIMQPVTPVRLVVGASSRRVWFSLTERKGDGGWLVSAKVNCRLHILIYSSVSLVIIARAPFPDTPHALDEADVFTLLLERQRDLIPRVSSATANQRGTWRGGRGGQRRLEWSARKSDTCRRVNKYYYF